MNKGKVYAASDFHGCYAPFDKMMNFLKPEDTLFFLGDATDRGDDGVKIFQTLMNDPRVRMIKGNHDEMMANAIPFVWAEIKDINYCGSYQYSLWYQNGGRHTAQSFWDMTEEEVYAIKNAIDKMPTKLTYTSPAGHTVILEHAGYTPFNIPHHSHDPLWDRDHFHDRWNTGYYPDMVLDPDKTYLVHGHTPVQYLRYMYGYEGKTALTKEQTIEKRQFMQEIILDGEEIIKPTIVRYCDGHKFDIDMCTIASNRIALLDLDTFEEIYFDGEEEKIDS